MIGLMGDAKNTGSLIANMREQPAEKGEPHNPDMGLVHAAEQILEAVKANDADTLKGALKSFVRMCTMQMEQENKDKGGYAEEIYSKQS